MQFVLDPATKSEPTDDSPSIGIVDGPATSTLTFVETCFIPNHVALKTQAGRTHYHAILKHVLRPETVDRMLLPYRGVSKSKLRSVPGWPYLDETRLCDISPDHVRQLTSLAVKHGYSRQTVKHIKNVIGAIISHAKKERILSGDNPSSQVHLPTIERKIPDRISLVDAKTIYRMLGYPERQIALIILISAVSNSAINVSEVCGLRWSHVNLTMSSVCAEEDVVPPHSMLIKYQRNIWGIGPVTPDRVRTISISPPLYELLNALRRQQRRLAPAGFVFSHPSGAPISPASISGAKLKPIGRQLGFHLSWRTLKEVNCVLLQDLCSKLTSELVAL